MDRCGQGASPPVLIVGIGNILLRDEGVGVRAIEAMRALTLPEGVEIVDGGTSGADLIDIIANRRKLIVIDAVDAVAQAGAVFRFQAGEWMEQGYPNLSLHQLGLVETLAMAALLGCAPEQVVIFGIKPKEVSPGLELSEEVRSRIPLLIELVLAEAQA